MTAPKTPKIAAYLTVAEAAEYLGVSTNTVRRQIYAGSLPAFRMSGHGTLLRVRRVDLDGLMQPVQSAAGVGK